MKKNFYLLVFVFSISLIQNSNSQTPTYSLTARNFDFTQGCGYWNSIEFDIELQNTGSVPLEYAAGQYLINLDTAVRNGGVLSYEIVSSALPANLRPRNPSIAIMFNPTSMVLRLAANTISPQGIGYTIAPGEYVVIVRMRLSTTAIQFTENSQPNFVWRNSPASVFTRISAFVNGSTTDITTPSTHFFDTYGPMFCFGEIPWCTCRFNHSILISSIIEGLYDTAGTLNRKDTLTIELREEFFPYDIIESQKITLDSISLSSYLVFFHFGPPMTEPLYIVIKHFNSVETWSKFPSVYTDEPLYFYDFTASAQSAYGDNLKLIGDKFAMYSGDVNQDRTVDALDVALIDNGIINFISGRFLPEDLNGDNVVDALDIRIADNNAYNFVTAIIPN